MPISSLHTATTAPPWACLVNNTNSKLTSLPTLGLWSRSHLQATRTGLASPGHDFLMSNLQQTLVTSPGLPYSQPDLSLRPERRLHACRP
jgi:hypothetical protein